MNIKSLKYELKQTLGEIQHYIHIFHYYLLLLGFVLLPIFVFIPQCLLFLTCFPFVDINLLGSPYSVISFLYYLFTPQFFPLAIQLTELATPMKPDGGVKNNSPDENSSSKQQNKTPQEVNNTKQINQTDQLKLKLKQLKDRQKQQQKQQEQNSLEENKSASSQQQENIQKGEKQATNLEQITQKLEMRKPQQLATQSSSKKEDKEKVNSETNQSSIQNLQNHKKEENQQHIIQSTLNPKHSEQTQKATEDFTNKKPNDQRFLPPKEPELSEQNNKVNEQNKQDINTIVTDTKESEPLQSKNLTLLSPLLSKAGAKINEDAVKQIDICKRLLNRQAELSKQLQSSQIGQHLSNTSAIIQTQSYKQVTSLRPKSAEVPGMSFTHKRQQINDNMFLKPQQINAFKHSLEEDRKILQNNLQENRQSDFKIDVEQILRFKSIKTIINDEINQNMQLSDKILKSLNNYKKAGVQESISGSKNELKLVAQFKGNIKFVLKIINLEDESSYVLIENFNDKSRITYEDTVQFVPFVIDAACVNIDQSLDQNQESGTKSQQIMLYFVSGMQIYVMNLGTVRFHGAKLLSTLQVGSGKIIKITLVQKFIQGQGNIKVLLLWDLNAQLHIYDTQKHELRVYKVPRPSAAINDAVYGQFVFCDIFEDVLAFASINGLVGIINISNILENSQNIQRIQQDSLDALSILQVADTINRLFLIKNVVYVSIGGNKILKFYKTQNVNNIFFKRANAVEIQLPEIISTSLNEHFISQSGNLYDQNGNLSGGGQKYCGKWSRIDQNCGIRMDTNRQSIEIYSF